MDNEASIMPEQVSLLDRHPSDRVWAGRLTVEDPVADLGDTFIVNGLVTPARVVNTALTAPESLAEAARQLSAMTIKDRDALLIRAKGGNPDAPPYMGIDELSSALGVCLTDLPGEYDGWRFTTEIYALLGGALYLVLGEQAVRHRVLSGDEFELTFVQRLLPFRMALPSDLTGRMLFLVAVPARAAAIGGLRGFRRSLLSAGAAASELASMMIDSDLDWTWDTEFYDDVCCRILGVDGVERVPTHIAYQTIPDVRNEEHDA